MRARRGVAGIVCMCITACTQWQSTITVPAREVRHVTLSLTTDGQITCNSYCSGQAEGAATRDDAMTAVHASCLAACPGAVESPGPCDFEQRAMTPHEQCIQRRREQAVLASNVADLDERRRLLLALPDCSKPTAQLADHAGAVLVCAELAVGRSTRTKTVDGRCAEQHEAGIVDCTDREVDSGIKDLTAIATVVLLAVAAVSSLAAVRPTKGW